MKQDIKQIEINGKMYVEKNTQKAEGIEVINFTGKESVASLLREKKVIVRSRNEGVNCGIVKMADETGIILKNARRLYYHKPRDNNQAWYEGVANSGLSKDSKVSPIVIEKYIIEDYSCTICTDAAYKNIMEKESENS